MGEHAAREGDEEWRGAEPEGHASRRETDEPGGAEAGGEPAACVVPLDPLRAGRFWEAALGTTTLTAEPEVVVEVRDNGLGVPADRREQLTDQFVETLARRDWLPPGPPVAEVLDHVSLLVREIQLFI